GCGVGAYGYATLFTVLLCLLMVLLHVTNFGSRKNAQKVLKITIPEDLDYEGAFDDIFEAYTKSHDLRKVKTTDMGSLFELSYLVVMDSGKSQKQFIDAIRCRNGNLSIILSMAAEPCDY
ncbi:MAG: DUF4956 domain-containing protein, partial [Clostridiales bacterium]|nr:DUF4956 domain-containing protein [Clostridiales bacterium]